ncbi:carbohydrate deacetylase [Mangrovimicrobium sediminis]|nr:ChbG/HpnK family deacetylase [Haliea sp. SAOS-164]
MKLLIVNADDFGLNTSVNEAIAECHRAGNLTSTTLMVNAPATAEAVDMARAMPELGVGLHFNLTQGMPLTAGLAHCGLADARRGSHDRRRVILGALAKPAARAAIREELRAQYQRMLDLGLEPTHIDSHQHVHGAPPIFAAMAELCLELDLPMRVPWADARSGERSLARRLRRTALRLLLDSAVRPWADRLRCNTALASVFDLSELPPALSDTDYARLLADRPDGVLELMVHPARSEQAMQGATRIGAVSEAEWRYLRNANLPALAATHGYTLGNYAHIQLRAAAGAG